MSGFVAVFDIDRRRDLPTIVGAMSSAMRHRGEVSRTFDLANHGVAVATREYESGVFWTLVDDNEERVVVFDGFLFNEKETCESLAAETLGEAIWQGFRRDGSDWFAGLDGSFAIAIHDRNKDNFYLVRDRFGHRPLLIAVVGRQILCGSEVKSFFAHPDFTRTVNQPALPSFFSYGLEVGSETLFEGVHRCLPGRVCEIRQRQTLTQSLYYRPRPEIDNSRTLDELETRLDQQLAETIGAYSRRCGRVGVFLSGGLDSALIANKLSDIARDRAHAISFGASNWAKEESASAETAARQLDLPFARAWADTEFDPLSHLRDAIRHIEAPTRFENAIALEVASRAASGLVDCVLTGEAADDLFGDSSFVRARQLAALWKLPSRLRSTMGTICGLVPTRFMQSASRYLHLDSMGQYWCDSYLWSPELAYGKRFLPPVEQATILDAEFGDLAPVQWLILVEVLGFLYHWNERMERIGAAHGLDVLHPFQRNKTLDLALTNPYHLAVQNGGRVLKPAVRRLTAKRLGDAILTRPKQPLAAPFGLWLDSSPDLRDAALALRSHDCLIRPYLNSPVLDRLLQDFEAHGASDKQTMKSIFMLLSFQLWLEQFLHDPMPIQR